MDRPTPFDLVFSGLAPDHFPALKDALAAAAADPRDRDAFLLTRPAMALLRELRPGDAEATGGIEELTALLHHAYLAWADGVRTWSVDADRLRRVLATPAASDAGPATAAYLQLPERLIWASLEAAGPWEPLDGCFVHRGSDGSLRVLGVFGMHPARGGFTVAEANGTPGSLHARRDGSPLFAPALAGGELAGLSALVEAGELVELAGRVLADAANVTSPQEGA